MRFRFAVSLVLLLLVIVVTCAVAAPIHDAAAKGDLEGVKALLRTGPKLLNMGDIEGATPLHHAVAGNHIALVEFLLASKANVNAKKQNGVMPLHIAAALGMPEIAKVLLAKGADPSAADLRGRTPTSLAESKGYPAIVELLAAAIAAKNSAPAPDTAPKIVAPKREPRPKMPALKKETPPKVAVIKKETPPKVTVVKKEAPPKVVVVKKETPPKVAVVKKEIPPKVMVVKKETLPKVAVIKKELPPKVTVAKKETPPKVTVIKKETPPKVTVVKKETAPKVAVIKKEAPPKVAVVKKDTPAKIAVIKKEVPPKVAVVKNEALPKVTVVKKEIPPKVAVIKKETPPKVTVVKKETAPKVAVIKKDTPPKVMVAKNDTPAKDAKSDTKAADVTVNPKDGAEMVLVPAGEFLMGSSDAQIAKVVSDNSSYKATDFEDEKPQHKVYLDGYLMYKYEVTVAQYKKFCSDTSRAMPEAPSWGWIDNHPMVNVNWQDAADYAKWAGATLPTEAQWEKSAVGTDGRIYPWGSDWDASKCNEHSANLQKTQPVGTYPAGVSPYGCLDLAGNVWEWCADWYAKDYYVGAPDKNPTGPASGTDRVLRGGSWYHDDNGCFRGAYRTSRPPTRFYDCFGFRCAKTP